MRAAKINARLKRQEKILSDLTPKAVSVVTSVERELSPERLEKIEIVKAIFPGARVLDTFQGLTVESEQAAKRRAQSEREASGS